MSTPTHTSTRVKRNLSEFEFLNDPKSKTSKLGKGSFASVRLVREKKTNNLYAMKIMNANPMKVSRSHMQNLQNEVSIHRSLDHPNIIKFYDYIQEGFNIYHVLELAQNGTLYNFIHKKKILTPNEVFQFFYQTCLAVQYLHKNNVFHRDLKPENILLDKDMTIKVCDFGWSARNIKEKRTTFCGTYEYMAPEIVKKKSYDYRVDIWSLGVLLYELCHGEAPYKGRSLEEITVSLAKPTIKFAATVQSEVKDLIQKILKNDPEERLSIDGILSHPWVNYHVGKQQMNNTVNSFQDFMPAREVASKSTPNIDHNAIKLALQPEKKYLRLDTSIADDNINEYEPHNAPIINFQHPSIKRANEVFNRPEPLTITVPRNVVTPVHMNEDVLETEADLSIRPICERSQSDRIHIPLSATLPKPATSYVQNFDVKHLPSDSAGKNLREIEILSPEFNTKVNNYFFSMSMTPSNSQKDISIPNPLSTRSPNKANEFASASQSAAKVQYNDKSPMSAKEIRQQLRLDAPNENSFESASKHNYKQYIQIINPKMGDLTSRLGQIGTPTYKINFNTRPEVATAKASQSKHFSFEPNTPTAPAHKHFETSAKKNMRVITETLGSSHKKQRTEEKSFHNVVLNSAQKDEIVKKLNFDADSTSAKDKENRVDMLLKNARQYISIDKLISHR